MAGAARCIIRSAEHDGRRREDRPLEKARLYRLARRSGWEAQAALEIGVRLEVLEPSEVRVVDSELDAVCAMLWTMTMRAQAPAAREQRANRKH